MRVVGRQYIEDFLNKNRIKNRTDIDIWLCEANAAQWHSYQDIQAQYNNIDYFEGNKIIFKLNENYFYLETKVSFNNKIVLIKNLKLSKDIVQINF